MRRRFHRGSRAGGKKRQVRWGGAWWYGNNVSIDHGADTGTVANFWVRWPTGLPDPDNDELRNEEDTWIKCFNYEAASTSSGGEQSALMSEVAFGLIAWDAMDPLDFGLTNGIFPNPLDQNFDWIWRGVSLQGVSNTIISNPGIGSDAQLISKAMRKQPPGTGVVALIGQQNSAAIPLLVSWTWDVRFAVKTQ